jgi:hypothetical protein
MMTPIKLKDPRLGLRTSATFATVFVILGHTVFGFEQPISAVLVALVTGYSCALFFEWIDSRASGIRPCFLGGGPGRLVDFLLSPHMTSITLSFLFYFNRRLWIMAFAVAVAIGSKYVLRVPINGRLRHFMNPSNLALAVVLAFYTWTGVLPWAYTIDLPGAWKWIVPLIIVALGMRLNLLFTGRLPTIASWLVTFVLLAFFRTWYRGSPITAELVVLTGIPMVLFTLYMITDPQTSPSGLRSQILFGSGIAVAYCILLLIRIQYTMFYSVTAVCAIRGMYLAALSLRDRYLKPVPSLVQTPVAVGIPSLARADSYPAMTSAAPTLREEPSAVFSSNT